MKRKRSGGELDFSYSRMGMYLECPQRYYFRYIRSIPEKPKSYFAFGHAIHSALEYLYRVPSPPFPSLNDVLKRFEAEWNATPPAAKGYTDPDKARKDYLDGVQMLTAYHAKHGRTLHVPLAVEYKTTLPIDGLAVISIVDRIDDLGGGKVGIVDYKTGKTLQREPDQLRMYQKILENSPEFKELVASKLGNPAGITVERLSFYHVPTLKESVFERASDAELSDFWNKVLSVAANIRAAKFDATPSESKCRFCDYRDMCPVFTSPSAHIAKPAAHEEPLPQPDTLSAKIDRYGELLMRSAEIKSELEGLKNEITLLMKEKGVPTHFGKKYRAALSRRENLEFPDKNAVMAFLKESGLLAKALVPTQSSICRLLDDEAVPAELKAKLRQLSRPACGDSLECSPVGD